MAKQTQLFLTHKHRLEATKFLPADTTSTKTLAAAGLDLQGFANDSNLLSISISSDDTIDNWLQLALTDGANSYNWLSIKIPLLTSALKRVNVEAIIADAPLCKPDNNGGFYVKLSSGWTLTGSLFSTISANKFVDVICSLEDF